MLSSFTSPTRLPPATTLPVTSHGDRLTLPRYFIASLLPHFAQEALPVGNRAAKILRDGLPHIRQCVPHSQVHARPASRRIRQNRHVLPRMVRRRPARIGIAAVICGDHHHVGQTQQRQELRKGAVKCFQRFGESLHVFPVAVQHVEIHQVAKNESALAFADRRRQFFHAVGVALCRHVFFDSAAVVNVMNLANSENANFTLRENIHQHRLGRIHRIIMPPRRPNIMSGHSRKWPREHPSHAVRPIQQFPCDLAHAIELGNWNHLFMRGDLKHAIARRVHNRLARPHVFFAQLLDNLRTGCWLVSDRLLANLLLEFFDQISRESVFVNRKRLVQPHPGHFPMSGRRIFSGRDCRSLAIRSKRSSGWNLMLQRRDVRQSEAHQIRDLQRPRFSDMSKRVPAHVAILRRIRELSNPHAIQHDPENSLEFPHNPAPQVPFARTVPHCLPGNPPRQFRSYVEAGLQAPLFAAPASSRYTEFLPAPLLLYSATSRSLNYLPFARVVQDSGGVPWPRTAIPGEFPSSSRSSSLRSALSFSSAIGIRASIPCPFSGPTGRSFSSLSASERYGITCEEAAIPTRLREFPSAPPLVRSRLSSCWSCFSGTDAAFPAATAFTRGQSTTHKLWICREQSWHTPGWRWEPGISLSTAVRATSLTRTSPTATLTTSRASSTASPAASANSTFLRSPTPSISVALKTIGICTSARTSPWN